MPRNRNQTPESTFNREKWEASHAPVTTTTTETQEESTKPSKSASKAEWVAFAVSEGASEEEANGMTKDQLIAEFGED